MADGVWLRLRFRGRQAALFSAAREAQVKARGLRARGEDVELELPLEDVGRLRAAVRGQGRLTLVGHGGWPLALRSLRRRPWRVALPILAAIAYFAASSFVWRVEVVGPAGLPVKRLLQAARADGLWPGASRLGLRPRALGLRIQQQVGGLIFCTVRLDGVQAYIYAAPELRPPAAPPPPSYGAITADETGYVTRVVAERGQPVVKAGETVLIGQPLILPRGGEARGAVYARVWRTYEYTVPLATRRHYVTGRTAQRWYIRLPWGLQWAPQGTKAPFAQARVQRRSWRIPFLSVEVTRLTSVELRTVTLRVRPSYAEAQAKAQALSAVSRALPTAHVLAEQVQGVRRGSVLRVLVRVEAEIDIARAATGGRTQD